MGRMRGGGGGFVEKEGKGRMGKNGKGRRMDGQRVRRESQVSRRRKRTTREEEEADGSQTLDWREGKGESPYK